MVGLKEFCHLLLKRSLRLSDNRYNRLHKTHHIKHKTGRICWEIKNKCLDVLGLYPRTPDSPPAISGVTAYETITSLTYIPHGIRKLTDYFTMGLVRIGEGKGSPKLDFER